MPQLVLTEEFLVLPGSPPAEVPSVDLVLNGHRVWSIDLISEPTARETLEHRVPAALQPHLNGAARVEVRDSVTGRVLWRTDTTLGSSVERIEIRDASGRHLAINKWGRLGKSFEGDNTNLHRRLLDRLDELVAFCHELGLRPFIVGGTLLGAVRAGAVLAHDDDADLAYLSEHSHPSDLARESFQIERALTAKGYDVFRHSTAHLQVMFPSASGTVDGYIDLFTAFFRDGTINQPFHVRAEMAASSMLPFSTVTLEGRPYPAPAVVEDWLVANYDENWRTPLPGYRLRTPRATSRRFQSWFGSSHFKRDFWEGLYAAGAPSGAGAEDLRGARLLAAELPTSSTVIDLGCGTGASARELARLGHRVTGVDYSDAALHRASAHSDGAEVDWRRLNLIEPRQSAELLAELGASATPVHALVEHVVERMGHHGRHNVWRLLRQYVRRGGTVRLVFDTLPDPEVTFHDPTTWHLDIETVKVELASLGMGLRKCRPLGATERDQERGTLTAVIVLTRTPGAAR